MDLFSQRSRFARFVLALSFIILFYTAFQTWLYKLSVWNAVAFLCYQLFVILLPGMACGCLLKRAYADAISSLGFGYAFGYAINIALYFLLFTFGLQRYAVAAVAAVAVVSAIVLWRNHGSLRIEQSDSRNCFCIVFFLVAVLGLSTVTYSFLNLTPDLIGNSSIINDILYWINNSVALSRGYPATSVGFAGTTIKYHVFTNAQTALMHTVTGIDIVKLSLSYYPLQPAILLTFGSYCAARNITANTKRIALIMFLALFVTSFEPVTIITYIWHLYTGPFSMDVGIALLMYVIALFKLQDEEDAFSWKNCLCAILLFAAACGVKGPVGAMLLLFMGMLCFTWLLKKRYASAFIYGALALASFFVVYHFTMQGTASSIGVTDAAISTSSMNFTHKMKAYAERLAQAGILQHLPMHDGMSPLWWPVVFVVTSFLCNPILFVMFLAAIVRFITKQLKWTAWDTVCVGASTVAILLTINMTLGGSSEVYFAMCAFPLTALFVISVWDRAPAVFRSKATFPALVTVMVIAASLLLVRSYRFIETAKSSLHNISSRVKNVEQPYRIFFDTDMDALTWVRDNTDTDAIILTDGSFDVLLVRYYPAFSNRQCYYNYVGSYGYNVQLQKHRHALVQETYDNNSDALGRVIQEGVDYVIWTPRVTPRFVANPERLRLAYQTESMLVYQVVN